MGVSEDGVCSDAQVNGWSSKLWSLFGCPEYSVPYYYRDPKRAHNFDNHANIYAWDKDGHCRGPPS